MSRAWRETILKRDIIKDLARIQSKGQKTRLLVNLAFIL